jgi:hypothetical protein
MYIFVNIYKQTGRNLLLTSVKKSSNLHTLSNTSTHHIEKIRRTTLSPSRTEVLPFLLSRLTRIFSVDKLVILRMTQLFFLCLTTSTTTRKRIYCYINFEVTSSFQRHNWCQWQRLAAYQNTIFFISDYVIRPLHPIKTPFFFNKWLHNPASTSRDVHSHSCTEEAIQQYFIISSGSIGTWI